MHFKRSFILVVAIINLQLFSSSHASKKDNTCSFVSDIIIHRNCVLFYYSTVNFKFELI